MGITLESKPNTRVILESRPNMRVTLDSKPNTRVILKSRGLPLGLALRISLDALPPRDPPSDGADWPPEIDYPRVRLILHHPSPFDGLCDEALTAVGERLTRVGWGEESGESHERRYVIAAHSSEAAHNLVTYAIDAAERILADALNARIKRLERRSDKYEEAVESPGMLVWPPI